MKNLLGLAAALLISGPVFADNSDKDILRDACSAIKPPAKKSACFDALDRLSAPPAAQLPVAAEPAPAAKKLMLNVRALQCERFEFSELDSMKKDGLEAAACSFDSGNRLSEETSKRFVEKETNPTVKVALLRSRLSTLEKCHSESAKAYDLFERKFAGAKIDCSKMPGKFAPQEADAARPASP